MRIHNIVVLATTTLFTSALAIGFGDSFVIAADIGTTTDELNLLAVTALAPTSGDLVFNGDTTVNCVANVCPKASMTTFVLNSDGTLNVLGQNGADGRVYVHPFSSSLLFANPGSATPSDAIFTGFAFGAGGYLEYQQQALHACGTAENLFLGVNYERKASSFPLCQEFQALPIAGI